jgi:subfamily B ATP-binding cassette protein MsbA
MTQTQQPSPINTSRVIARLWRYSATYWWAFVIAIISNLVYAAMDVIFINSLKPLTDETLVGNNIAFMKMAPFFVMAVLFIRGIASFLSSYFMALVGQSVVMKMRQQLIDTYLKLPGAYFDKNASGELISKVTFNTQQVALASTDALTKLFREGGTVLFILASLFYYNWKLTALFLISAPLIGFIVNLASRRFKVVSQRIQDAMGGVTQTASEIINGYRVVKTFNAEAHENTRFSQVAEQNKKQNLKLVITQAISVPLIQLIAAIALSGVIYYSAFLLEAKQMTPGEFVVMMALMMALLKPLKVISNINSILQQGAAAAQSIFEILDAEKEIDRGTIELENVKGQIEFEHVCFRYPNSEKYDIDDVNLTIHPGETIAIVGRSGSGKSTLTSLLLRFYDPSKGVIKIDGIDIRDIKLKSLRKNIGFISQHVVLFNDTIANNIAYPNHEIDYERLLEVSQLAHVHEFVESLPEGYQTLVGENGSRLSGGQRQRIAIARALYENAPILVMDEATSALDNESERHIQEAMQALMKNRTNIVIAHRLSTIEHADRIVVMEHGKIIEIGTHQQLIEKRGVYYSLYNMQFQ